MADNACAECGSYLFDLGKQQPHCSDCLEERMSEEAFKWLKEFAEFNKLKTISESVDKLIEIYKAWNKLEVDR